MFKVLLLLFLGWLAFRLIRAGRVVTGILRGMEEAMSAARGQPPAGPPRQNADENTSGVTVHLRRREEDGAVRNDAEDARFEDL